MWSRVSLDKLFAPSLWKLEAFKFGRNKGSRKTKRLYSRKAIPTEWRSATTSYGYPVNMVKGSVNKQIVNALHLGERERASSLLSHIGYNKHMLTANHFVQILEYCAMTPDPLFVMEIWRTMEEKGIGINNRCHLLMIQAFCNAGYIEEAFNLMSNCGETPDLYPTLAKYNTLLGASIRMKSESHANKCLDLMEHDMVGHDEETYRNLLELAVLQKNPTAVHITWKEYTKYYSLNPISLRKFIWAFSSLGDLEAACEALQQLVTLVFQGGFTIKKNAEEKMTISRLDIPMPFYGNLDWSKCRKLNMASVPCVYEDYKKMGTQASRMDHHTIVSFDMEHNSLPVMRILKLSFTDVICACARAKSCQLAEQLFFQMPKLGVKPSRGAYDGLIKVLAEDRGFHDGMEVLKLMQQRNLKPRDSTLGAISISCSKGWELDLAEAFLDQMSKCTSSYPYNALLEACSTLDQPERGLQVFRKMKQLKVASDIVTYQLLFSLFGNVNAPYEFGDTLSQVDAAKRINAIEDDMVRNGIEHNFYSMRSLLYALGAEGMISGLLRYLSVAENQFSLGTPIYNIVLNSLVRAKEGPKAIKIFRNLISYGYSPNPVTFTIMINCCSITESFKSAHGLIAMMIRYGYSPQMQTYTALIKLVLESGNFKKALILLNQACSEGIQLDALLFNTILKAASNEGRIDIIEFVMKRMHEQRVPPDAATCGRVFSAYVKRGLHSTAMEALQVMSIHMLSEEDINENRTVFEDKFIYAEDSEAESRVLDLFKDSKENLATALLNLRCCAMMGNLISWSTNQSHWVKRLSAMHSFN